MKSKLFLATILAASAVLAHAQSQYRAAPPAYGYGGPGGEGQRPMYYQRGHQEEADNPATVLRDGMNKLLGFLQQDPRPSPPRVAAFLNKEIAAFFDFEYMARWAAGGLYRQMNDEQKQKLVARLQQMFLEAMAEKLGAYSNQRVRYMAPRPGRRGTVTVPVAVLNPQGYPARLEFRLYKGNDGWKVYDVAANGSSAIVYYRSYFNRTLRQQQRAAQYGSRPAERYRGY